MSQCQLIQVRGKAHQVKFPSYTKVSTRAVDKPASWYTCCTRYAVIYFSEPGRVRMLMLTPTCNSISATWRAPSDSGYPPFEYYTITLNESYIDMKMEDQRSYNFTGLRTGTKYKVTVTVNSDIFLSQHAKHTTTKARSEYRINTQSHVHTSTIQGHILLYHYFGNLLCQL